MSKLFRYYQEEANEAIYEEMLVNNKCIVKMFCGSGKSLIMRKCKTIEGKNLVVFVFPSLSLIDQFYGDYLRDFPSDSVLQISSENNATTDQAKITYFISKKTDKIICITYQSFKTLVDCINEIKIDVCIFDEAHHAVGEIYQKLIFENDICEKQIFFTATPKNANGIIMHDAKQTGMCGKLVYDYSYLKGVYDGYLNPFEIRIDMFTENTNKSIYESIARAILASGNNRVLTFHSDVSTERNTSVNNFVNDAEFKRIFKEIQLAEFPDITKYKKINMIGLSASIGGTKRRKILENFDTTKDNQVIVISSCETIGEGIDTKNANMCVFVDPKSSYVKIIQNIGRIVRKVFGITKPNSTILIPCWVDKTKYLECGGDKEKCDEVIRQEMAEGGNFNGILNVLSALKQEDEELYDICLNYPNSYSPQEIQNILEKQGYIIDDVVGDGTLMETLENLLDTEIDYENYEDYETDEEMIMQIAEDNDVCIEIHTNSLENPVEKYNSNCENGEIIRLYKTADEDLEENVYYPIVKKSDKSKRCRDSISEPKKVNRLYIKAHTNSDIKVLWNITADTDFTKDICSCIMDCEVIKYDPMDIAKNIVERANSRQANNMNLLPRRIKNKNERQTPELEQENIDARKLGTWKAVLKGNRKSGICSIDVRDYLDENLQGWRTEPDDKAIKCAINITERANNRQVNNMNLLPRTINDKNKRQNPELEQEHKDAIKLGMWKYALKGTGSGSWKCPDIVRDYLDENLPGWRTDQDYEAKAMEDAINIVERAKNRQVRNEHLLPRQTNKQNPELEQEFRDAIKLGMWKRALKGKIKNGCVCYDNVRNYLDENLPGWRTEQDYEAKAMEDAINIVERAKNRLTKNENLLPRQISKQNRLTPEMELEHKDASKLGMWKKALKGKGNYLFPDEVCFYLDENLPGWRTVQDFEAKAMEEAKNIVKRAYIRQTKNKHLLPSHIDKVNRLTPELKQEHKDAQKLCVWKRALKGKGQGNKCYDLVCDYLDKQLQGWRTEHDEKAMEDAINIVQRAKNRQAKNENLLPRQTNKQTYALKQEYEDAIKLKMWKESLSEKGTCKCPNAVCDYLDEHLPGWRTERDFEAKAMEDAINIVERANIRQANNQHLLPKNIQKHNRKTSELKQENNDAQKLSRWKRALDGSKNSVCFDTVRDYLDENLLGWRTFDKQIKPLFKATTETIPITHEKPAKTQKPKKSMKLPKSSTIKESTEQTRARIKSEMSILHQKYKILKSENLHKDFNETPELWNNYHNISEENEKSFPEDEIPRNRVIAELNKIKTKRTKTIVDMGCGKAQISKYFSNDKRFQFINYDHISFDETIISCDISNTPLEEDSAEICILSLAMWGSNCKEYIAEANRILESGGKIYIIEPTKRWTEKDEAGNIVFGKQGNKLKSLLEEFGFKIIEQSIEKFCMFICIKI